ncbi:oxidoreductase [Fructilactobacillus lindneri]|uniref:Short-chain dehydrogenase oxidoreductase n=2 Tax=Fructilactobacillus lindneri TaxID=53444 RepID=A0A0R2JLY5_9LACO|nr:SDR family oxidoreductase [Fructilactobacillus lindneri]ANZ57586.1 oxidoreductase [Fructilactobacillus lindneri]ANZ58855.1 oxidoreductase [Fructilactobacillus lindneri]KRN78223.1 short-chain dehydrogenase oxidoreductase [Fructilactobacillus lindneri DSM 20690 = JCM 11027]POG97737.1 oxidoreductase [Fructilactobacillus lindneri]POH00038.1 oxidoreductase [Fructilactobacillus lindneri]
MTIKNKVVVITGGSSGMGEATTKLALERGAKVVVGSRNQAKLEKMATEVSHPENFAYKLTDVTKSEDVQDLVDSAIEKFGKLDVLYNNAGIMPQGMVDDPKKLAEWQAILNTNIMGVLNGIVAAVPQMKKQGNGLIMATDSVAGHVVYPGSAVYNGSKFAVRAIMEGLRQEQHQNGIKTGIVSPGAVATNLFSTVNDNEIRDKYLAANKEKNGSLTPENIAELAVFMMSQPENVDINEILVRPTGQGI